MSQRPTVDETRTAWRGERAERPAADPPSPRTEAVRMVQRSTRVEPPGERARAPRVPCLRFSTCSRGALSLRLPCHRVCLCRGAGVRRACEAAVPVACWADPVPWERISWFCAYFSKQNRCRDDDRYREHDCHQHTQSTPSHQPHEHGFATPPANRQLLSRVRSNSRAKRAATA